MDENQVSVNAIVVPDDFPVPVHTFGQEVYLKDSGNSRGTIIGMGCTPLKHSARYWEYVFYQSHLGITDDWYDEDQLSVNPWREEEE